MFSISGHFSPENINFEGNEFSIAGRCSQITPVGNFWSAQWWTCCHFHVVRKSSLSFTNLIKTKIATACNWNSTRISPGWDLSKCEILSFMSVCCSPSCQPQRQDERTGFLHFSGFPFPVRRCKELVSQHPNRNTEDRAGSDLGKPHKFSHLLPQGGSRDEFKWINSSS